MPSTPNRTQQNNSKQKINEDSLVCRARLIAHSKTTASRRYNEDSLVCRARLIAHNKTTATTAKQQTEAHMHITLIQHKREKGPRQMVMCTHLTYVLAINQPGRPLLEPPLLEPRFNLAYFNKVSTSATASFVDSMRSGRGHHLKPRERRGPALRRRAAAGSRFSRAGPREASARSPMTHQVFFLTEITFPSRGHSHFFRSPSTYCSTGLAKRATC